MNTPLLAADEPDTVPSLSSPDTTDPDASSQLTVMLREASSPPSNATFLVESRSALISSVRRTTSDSNVSWITLLTGSLSSISIVLLWGSYVSTKWFEIRMSTEVSWLTPNNLDVILRPMDLGNIIGCVAATNQHFLVALLAVTSVIIPCLTMIVQPWAIVQRHSALTVKRAFQAKTCVDNFARFGFLLLFFLLLLGRVLSMIELDFSETRVVVYSGSSLGFAAFALGLLLTLFTIIVLRLSPSVVALDPSEDRSADDSEEPQYMRVLEDEAEEVTVQVAENEVVDTEPVTEDLPPTHHAQTSPSCSCSMSFILFESGLVSTIFLIASFILPLARIRFEGVASEFMPDLKLVMHLSELTSLSSTLPGSILIVIQVMVVPIVTMILATCYWFRLDSCGRWLSAWYPASNGLTFCAALLLTIPAIDPITQLILDEHTSGLCQQFQLATGQGCLNVNATIGAGTWCYLVHTLALEIFLLLTLWHKGKHQRDS